jgi:hypothetical protein
MMSRSVFLPTCILVVAAILVMDWGSSVLSFIPCTRRQAATGLAASLSAMLLNTETAQAKKGTKFSVFGFGDGYSDPYATMDVDSPSPYSEFSNPDTRIKFERNPEILARRKENLKDSFSRLEKIPDLIRAKNSEDVKSVLTLQLQTMRENMEYITTGGTPFFRDDNEKAPGMVLANDFFQDVAQLGVHGGHKKWEDASTSYSAAMEKLAQWQNYVAF